MEIPHNDSCTRQVVYEFGYSLDEPLSLRQFEDKSPEERMSML